jgi:hypothetical protein
LNSNIEANSNGKNNPSDSGSTDGGSEKSSDSAPEEGKGKVARQNESSITETGSTSSSTAQGKTEAPGEEIYYRLSRRKCYGIR